jgi:hypothetical protein
MAGAEGGGTRADPSTMAGDYLDEQRRCDCAAVHGVDSGAVSDLRVAAPS